MLLQATLLEKISTKNLVTVSVSQTQLQTNFQLLLQALRSHDSLLSTHNKKIQDLQASLLASNKSQQELSLTVIENHKNLKADDKAMGVRIDAMENWMSRLQAKLAEVTDRANPEAEKSDGLQTEDMRGMALLLKKLEQKVGIAQGNIYNLERKVSEIDVLGLKLTAQAQKIVVLEEEVKKLKANLSSQKMAPKASTDNSSLDLKSIYNDLNALKIDIAKLGDETTSNSSQLQQITKTSIPKLKQGQEEANKRIKKMSDDIWKLNQQVYNAQKHNREVELSNKAAFEAINQRLNDIEDILSSFKTENTSISRGAVSARQTQIPQWSSPQGQKKDNQESMIRKDIEKDESANFRKEIIDKLKQQRTQFNKALRKLDNAGNKKEGDTRLNDLEERVLRLQHLLDGKVDEDMLKKWMKYIENKIGYIYRIVNVENAEEDAYIARKNWNCLSCDKKLENYRGKIGNHLISAQLKSKGVDQEVVGGGMLFKTKSKYELPQFRK